MDKLISTLEKYGFSLKEGTTRGKALKFLEQFPDGEVKNVRFSHFHKLGINLERPDSGEVLSHLPKIKGYEKLPDYLFGNVSMNMWEEILDGPGNRSKITVELNVQREWEIEEMILDHLKNDLESYIKDEPKYQMIKTFATGELEQVIAHDYENLFYAYFEEEELKDHLKNVGKEITKAFRNPGKTKKKFYEKMQ